MSDNIILIEDFNVELEEENMFDFLNIYNLVYLVEQKLVDSSLTNWHSSFQNTNVFGAELYDFH